jgi:hypothetical protein
MDRKKFEKLKHSIDQYDITNRYDKKMEIEENIVTKFGSEDTSKLVTEILKMPEFQINKAYLSDMKSRNIGRFVLSQNQIFLKKIFSPNTDVNGMIMYHQTGSGKCHKIDTPLIMHDGTIKMVQDLKVGDLLMGDDSTSRKILSLAKGEDMMYEIKPIKGESFTVNSEHILCLKITNQGITYNTREKRYKVLDFNKSTMGVTTKNFIEKSDAQIYYDNLINTEEDKIVEISVKDYLKLSNGVKHLLKVYKKPVFFPHQEIDFDPYILGFWLGDGTSRDPAITTQDSTVLKYLNETVIKYDLMLNYMSGYSYRLSSIKPQKGSNVFLNTLKKYNMLNNKHIPHILKCNSREIQLQLLAGIIDSDGHLDKKNSTIEITQKNETLMDDIVFLCRSLGFSAYKKIKKTSWTYKNEKKYGSAFRINVNGDIDQIPTKIIRKQAEKRKQKKDVSVLGFKVKQLEIDDYYGFTLNGNCRYLLDNFIVTHNTCSALQIAKNFQEMNSVFKKKIIVLTSHDVIFKTEMFNLRKFQNGYMYQCLENEFLDCIEDINIKVDNDMTTEMKQLINNKVYRLIRKKYDFKGYIKFGNDIMGVKNKHGKIESKYLDKHGNINIQAIEADYSNRIIIIDEVHHIRGIKGDSDDSKKSDLKQNYKSVIDALHNVLKYGRNNKILFLSATPMFNSYKEINLLMQLLHLNDKIAIPTPIKIQNDVMSKEHEKTLLNFANKYVSFMRANNPYAFPIKLFPNMFKESAKDVLAIQNFPTHDVHGIKIEKSEQLHHVVIVGSKMSDYQTKIYNMADAAILESSLSSSSGTSSGTSTNTNNQNSTESNENSNLSGGAYSKSKLKRKEKSISSNIDDSDTSDTGNYNNNVNSVQNLKKSRGSILHAKSDIVWEDIDEVSNDSSAQEEAHQLNINNLRSLSNITYPQMKAKTTKDYKFKNYFEKNRGGKQYHYHKNLGKKYHNFLHPDNLSIYSPKISKIINHLMSFDKKKNEVTMKSDGVILIYTRYVDYGALPLSIALEHCGFNMFNNGEQDNLLDNEKSGVKKYKNNGLHYAVISGQQDRGISEKQSTGSGISLSYSNSATLERLTDVENVTGDKIKVIIITDTGTEGFDFKYIREIHVIDPWYNLNKIEQIIGRGIRFNSHEKLPEDQRNCMIYLHCILHDDVDKKQKKETIDFYAYRISEIKQKNISLVENYLKRGSIDCNLNREVLSFTKEMNLRKDILTSQKIDHKNYLIQDIDFSKECDYMKCNMTCIPEINLGKAQKEQEFSKLDYLIHDISNYVKYIVFLYHIKPIYNYKELLSTLSEYIHINEKIFELALRKMVEEKINMWLDVKNKGKVKRLNGFLELRNIKDEDYYVFQPSIIEDNKILLKERTKYYDYKMTTPFMVELKTTGTDKLKLKTDGVTFGSKDSQTHIVEVENKFIRKIDGKFSKLLEYLVIIRETPDMIIICEMIIDSFDKFTLLAFIDIYNSLYDIKKQLKKELKKIKVDYSTFDLSNDEIPLNLKVHETLLRSSVSQYYDYIRSSLERNLYLFTDDSEKRTKIIGVYRHLSETSSKVTDVDRVKYYSINKESGLMERKSNDVLKHDQQKLVYENAEFVISERKNHGETEMGFGIWSEKDEYKFKSVKIDTTNLFSMKTQGNKFGTVCMTDQKLQKNAFFQLIFDFTQKNSPENVHRVEVMINPKKKKKSDVNIPSRMVHKEHNCWFYEYILREATDKNLETLFYINPIIYNLYYDKGIELYGFLEAMTKKKK